MVKAQLTLPSETRSPQLAYLNQIDHSSLPHPCLERLERRWTKPSTTRVAFCCRPRTTGLPLYSGLWKVVLVPSSSPISPRCEALQHRQSRQPPDLSPLALQVRANRSEPDSESTSPTVGSVLCLLHMPGTTGAFRSCGDCGDYLHANPMPPEWWHPKTVHCHRSESRSQLNGWKLVPLQAPYCAARRCNRSHSQQRMPHQCIRMSEEMKLLAGLSLSAAAHMRPLA
ncbi:hypothetical protein VTK26DRAFT_7714 [Humicola hyalothermophila]